MRSSRLSSPHRNLPVDCRSEARRQPLRKRGKRETSCPLPSLGGQSCSGGHSLIFSVLQGATTWSARIPDVIPLRLFLGRLRFAVHSRSHLIVSRARTPNYG